MRIFLFIIISLTLLHSTTISGMIYDADKLSLLNETILTVENSDGSVILQQLCNSPYDLQVPEGNYTIRAYHFYNGTLKYYSDYKIQAHQETMQLDLFLLPYELLSLSPGFVPPPAIKPNNIVIKDTQEATFDPIYLVFAILILLVSIYWFISKIKDTAKSSVKNHHEQHEPDNDCKKILQIIYENEGRMVQKELREIVGFSETKMSLIITELEVSGYIKKIKKGRGNIIKLVK